MATERPMRRRNDSADAVFCDERHATPCPKLEAHTTFQEEIRTDLEEIKATLKELKEMLDVWKNMKGFISTIQVFGAVAKWLVATGAAIAAIYYWFWHQQ